MTCGCELHYPHFYEPDSAAIDDTHCVVADLYEALEMSDSLIVQAQAILAEYIVPDSGISDSDVIGRLLGLLDGPEQRITQSVTKVALAKALGE